MSRVPIALTQILRRYSFSYTQLRGRVVPYQVHGALRAPSNEADLGPARFRAGVHRRERCGPGSDGGQLARRLVRVVRTVANWPRRAASSRALAAAAADARKGSCRGPRQPRQPLCRPGPTDREPAKPTKKHCNGFTRHLSLDLADPRVDGRLVSSEAWAVPPDPCDWDSSAAVAAAAPRGCPI